MTDTISASSYDLTTLELVKSWSEIPPDNHNDDADYQDEISGFSKWVCEYTGIQSFNKLVTCVETRNGNGNYQMFVRTPPINSINRVIVNGAAVPAAGDWPSYGYFISDDLKSIWIRAAGAPASFTYQPAYYWQAARCAGGFPYGVGNVLLDYLGGYARVPIDLQRASTKAVAIYCRRKQTLDLASKALNAGGTVATTRYRDWDVPPEIMKVIENYKRQSII